MRCSAGSLMQRITRLVHLGLIRTVRVTRTTAVFRLRESHFGFCPYCGHNDGFLNFGPNHWFICHQHQSRWFVGSNLFDCWKEESEEDWQRTKAKIESYREVAPIHWTWRRTSRPPES
jgi:hypothetical protein